MIMCDPSFEIILLLTKLNSSRSGTHCCCLCSHCPLSLLLGSLNDVSLCVATVLHHFKIINIVMLLLLFVVYDFSIILVTIIFYCVPATHCIFLTIMCTIFLLFYSPFTDYCSL